MRFVPVGEIVDRPNVISDGAALPSTVLTLSHWPASPTPAALAEDTSARIAFRYLDDVRRWPAAEAVSNDHFDQDGLVTVRSDGHKLLFDSMLWHPASSSDVFNWALATDPNP